MNKYQIGDLVADKLNGRKMIVMQIDTNNQNYRTCRYECVNDKGYCIGYDWRSFHINELTDFVEKPVNEGNFEPETVDYHKSRSEIFDMPYYKGNPNIPFPKNVK
jgi:hypothetical protein